MTEAWCTMFNLLPRQDPHGCRPSAGTDRAASGLEHQRDLVFHAQEDTPEIDIDDSVPLFLVVVRDRSRLFRLDPRVVEGGIEPPKGFHGLVQSRLHLVSAPHIASD